LIARPSRGYRFTRWSGGCVSSDSTCLLGLSSSQIVRAHFSRIRGRG
jgi:hypothetical protein